jgi:hypothetical protein
MAYSSDLNFGDWVLEIGGRGQALISAVNAGEIDYQKWYAVTYGRTDAQVAALPQFSGRTEADITALRYALGAFHDLYTALHGAGAVSSRDRQADLVSCL